METEKLKSYKNKNVFFNYEIIEKYEAGIVLTGTEVKSLRDGKGTLNGTFCILRENELFIKDMNISVYEDGSYNNHDPKRDRKLLMHKKEIRKLRQKVEEKGMAIVPIQMYVNENGIFKLEIALAKGRKKSDKRDYIKERDTKKEVKEITGKSI